MEVSSFQSGYRGEKGNANQGAAALVPSLRLEVAALMFHPRGPTLPVDGIKSRIGIEIYSSRAEPPSSSSPTGRECSPLLVRHHSGKLLLWLKILAQSFCARQVTATGLKNARRRRRQAIWLRSMRIDELVPPGDAISLLLGLISSAVSLCET